MSVFKDDMLAGKHAFVTGGTSGINLAIAKRLARAGAKLSVIGRNPEKATGAESELRVISGNAIALTCDVRDYAALDAVVCQSVAKHGAIDILVAGAAGNFPAPAMGMSSNGFKAVVDIDLIGTFNTCRAAFAHLTKPGAAMLCISAGQAIMPALMQAHVCAAKAGIDMLMRVLAMEWGGAGVRINSLAPGPIGDTEGMKRLASTPETRTAIERSIPLGRFGTKDEMAELALFLCSPAAAYVHGALIVADGGQSLAGFGMSALG